MMALRRRTTEVRAGASVTAAWTVAPPTHSASLPPAAAAAAGARDDGLARPTSTPRGH